MNLSFSSQLFVAQQCPSADQNSFRPLAVMSVSVSTREFDHFHVYYLVFHLLTLFQSCKSKNLEKELFHSTPALQTYQIINAGRNQQIWCHFLRLHNTCSHDRNIKVNKKKSARKWHLLGLRLTPKCSSSRKLVAIMVLGLGHCFCCLFYYPLNQAIHVRSYESSFNFNCVLHCTISRVLFCPFCVPFIDLLLITFN